MKYKEDDLLALSGLQHYFYCKRQWALIQVEQQWIENLFTAQGRLLHNRVDNNKYIEYKEGVIIERSVSIKSEELGVYGVADVIEFYKSDKGIRLPQEDGLWIPRPIEYKRGRPKINICDSAQLCCQAMCLEETYGIEINNGYLFYYQTRHRQPIIFDKELREAVVKACMDMHDMVEKGITPEVPKNVRCKNCSLYNICIPEVNKNRSGKVEKYIIDNIKWGENA